MRVTMDRFHGMKNFQDGLTEARREMQRSLPKAWAKEWKGTRWLGLTNPENLTPEPQAELATLKERFPALGRLSEHREALRQIFEDTTIRTPEEGRSPWKAWCDHGREWGWVALEKFNGTRERWLNEIANSLASRSSHGRTEGSNHELRSVLWPACGMTAFRHFRLRVLHGFG